MIDYSQNLLNLDKAMSQYQEAMLQRNFEQAFQYGLDMIVFARALKIIAQDLAE